MTERSDSENREWSPGPTGKRETIAEEMANVQKKPNRQAVEEFLKEQIQGGTLLVRREPEDSLTAQPTREDLENRFMYHPPRSPMTEDLHAMMRREHLELAEMIRSLLPNGREKSLAITKLEESLMWANAAIARKSDYA